MDDGLFNRCAPECNGVENRCSNGHDQKSFSRSLLPKGMRQHACSRRALGNVLVLG